MSEESKRSKLTKKHILAGALLLVAVVLLVWGSITAYRVWGRGLDPGIFGKGYCVEFPAYTPSSAHGSSEPWYGLTRQGYCAFAMVNDAPFALCVEKKTYDPAAFGAQFIGNGYWQGPYNVSYINEKIVRTWYGENEKHNVWLLELDDGKLLLAEGYKRNGQNWEITGVDIIKPVCTQRAYFQYWNDRKEQMYLQLKETPAFQERFHGEDPQWWKNWKEFYRTYR